MPLDQDPTLGQELLEHRPGGTAMQAILRRRLGRRECLVEDRGADRPRPTQLREGRRSPRLRSQQLRQQNQAHANDPAVLRQGRDSPIDELAMLRQKPSGILRQPSMHSPQQGQNLPRVFEVEEVDGSRVPAIQQADLEAPEEPREVHPEVVADQKQG